MYFSGWFSTVCCVSRRCRGQVANSEHDRANSLVRICNTKEADSVTGVWEIILTTLLVNSRNLLLAAGLAHNLEAGATKAERLAVGSLTTDELFSVALLEKHQALPPAYVIGIGLSGYLSWVVGTAFGIGLTDLLPPALASSMGIGLYAMFLGLLVPALREQPQARLVTLIAVTINLVLYALASLLGIGHGLTIFIATVSAVALVTAAKERLQW